MTLCEKPGQLLRSRCYVIAVRATRIWTHIAVERLHVLLPELRGIVDADVGLLGEIGLVEPATDRNAVSTASLGCYQSHNPPKKELCTVLDRGLSSLLPSCRVASPAAICEVRS